MKQRDAYESQETTTTKRIPWNADNATESGPSSLEVLLMWMLIPGHYERLHSKQRNRAILSILSALKKNGIHHRSESGIRSKVLSIEKQYLSAKRWLEERNISSNDVVEGAVNAETEANVLALCPHYCDLFPVLRHSSYLNEVAAREMSTAEADQDEATDSDSKPKPARSKQKRKLEKKDDHYPSKYRRMSSYNEVAIHEVDDYHPRKTHVMNCVRRTTAFGDMHDDDIDLNDVHGWLRADQCELVVRDPTVQLPSELQRQVAEIKLDHVKKESNAVLENDDKMRAAMLECDIVVKRGRGKVQLMLEKVLARQTMKKEGVPKEEIDSVMPLKEL